MRKEGGGSPDRLFEGPHLLTGGIMATIFEALPLGQTLMAVHARALILTLLAWAPPAILTLIAGRFFPPGDSGSFLGDVANHVRILVALPCLVLAQTAANLRIAQVLGYFRSSGVVPPDRLPALEGLVERARKEGSSAIVDAVIIALALILAGVGLNVVAGGETWRFQAGGQHLSAAGLWARWFSAPVFVYLLLRWLYLILIWSRFIVRLSRIGLTVYPAHPDRAGGLGILNRLPPAFAGLVVAMSALLAGYAAHAILHEGASIADFKGAAIGLVAIELAIAVGPLIAYVPLLAAAKRRALIEYDALAHDAVEAFYGKWIASNERPTGVDMLDQPDFSSMADLTQVVETVRGMRVLPVGKATLLPLLAAAALPMLPTIALQIPMKEITGQLVGIIL
jgi:hypothetical protein